MLAAAGLKGGRLTKGDRCRNDAGNTSNEVSVVLSI